MQEASGCHLLGQYTHGRFSGTTLATFKLKHTTRYLNAFMTSHGADGTRSSLVVGHNVRVKAHHDLNNLGLSHSPSASSLEASFGPRSPMGTANNVLTRSGQVLRLGLHRRHDRLVTFDARRWREVEPWSGDRWTIAVFQTRSAKDLEPQQDRLLRDFGFQVDGRPSAMLATAPHAELLSAAVWQGSALPSFASSAFPSTSVNDIDEEQLEELDVEPTIGGSSSTQRVTEAQKLLLKKLHINTGHPPQDRFLKTLKAAGALPHVLKYVRDEFHCEACATKRVPGHRRKAQCPRVFSFNRVLSMDVFYLNFKGRNEAFLNVVDHGTNYQMAQRIPGSGGAPTSASTWHAFLTTWVRFVGPPSLIVTDGGLERHGGWLKQRLCQELESGQAIVETWDDVDEMLSSLVSAKNRWFNSGGYTPTRLVFGGFLVCQASCFPTTPVGSRP